MCVSRPSVSISDRTCLTNFLRKVFYDYDKKGYENLDTASRAAQTTTFLQDAVRLLFCSVGLLVSYLIWGLEQERIMTQVRLTKLISHGLITICRA